MNRASQSRILVLAYLFLGLLTVTAAVVRPYHNWDMIPYVALADAIADPEASSAAIHETAYARVRESVPAYRFEILAPEAGAGSDYRVVMKDDPEAFSEQLPFYRVRVLYIGLIYGLSRVGVDPVEATYLLPAVAVLCGTLVLASFARRHLSVPLGVAFLPLAAGLGVIHVGRLSTPDGLAFLGVMIAAWTFDRGRRSGFWILPLLVLIRSDLLLLSLLFLIALALARRGSWWQLVLSLLASLGVFWGVTLYSGHPGWARILHFSLIEKATHPLSSPSSLTLPAYLEAVARGVWRSLEDPAFLVFMSLAIVSVHLARRRYRGRPLRDLLADPIVGLLAVAVSYVGLHFLAFPAVWVRFFAAPYILTGIACFSMLSNLGARAES